MERSRSPMMERIRSPTMERSRSPTREKSIIPIMERSRHPKWERRSKTSIIERSMSPKKERKRERSKSPRREQGWNLKGERRGSPKKKESRSPKRPDQDQEYIEFYQPDERKNQSSDGKSQCSWDYWQCHDEHRNGEKSRIWESQNKNRYRNDHSFNGHQSGRETERVSTLDDNIAKLNWGIAKHVKENMNKYCPGFQEFDPSNHKIHDEDEYTNTAKMLTQNFLTLVKDSYEAYNGTLDGIRLTGDHKAFIQIQVEMYFSKIPVIKISQNNNNKTFDPKSATNFKRLVTIEDKAVDLKKKFVDIDINNICQRPGILLLHLSEEGLRDSQKQANRLNEEMQKLLETLDGVDLLPDQHGNIYF